MTGRGRTAVTRVAALALAAALAACGGVGATTPDPVRTQIGGGTFTVLGTVEANENGYNADVATGTFALGEPGTVEVTADWTSPDNNIDIFLYVGACTAEQARSNDCLIANRTSSATSKPERLNVIGVPTGLYSVGFVNFGPASETGTFQIHLTR
jgi:hypothetical protein